MNSASNPYLFFPYFNPDVSDSGPMAILLGMGAALLPPEVAGLMHIKFTLSCELLKKIFYLNFDIQFLSKPKGRFHQN
jgi:hypothetical protein